MTGISLIFSCPFCRSASSEKSTSETAETVPVASPQSRVSETVEVLNGHIGKRVSVISKSDIRYEGMLHVVDQSSESATIDKGAIKLNI